jgi:hypothetical protein
MSAECGRRNTRTQSGELAAKLLVPQGLERRSTSVYFGVCYRLPAGTRPDTRLGQYGV